jgi:wyosine [tRNA(Phe)-imidazoG37] synthetase (radical SAM superfamily)
MSTILFDEIIFGPLRSRRLGISLGINLLPIKGKVCSFDCLYCECGLNSQHKGGRLPKADDVIKALEEKLRQLKIDKVTLDVITFAGNGEPTLHPDFAKIIDETIILRDILFPKTKVSVLSNATQLDNQKVFNALLKVDNAILKLDSAFDETTRIMDRPVSTTFSVTTLLRQLKSLHGKLIIQTMFTRGSYEGTSFDNTTETEVNALIELIDEIRPQSVMVYTIDRETPVKGLEKITVGELNKIASKIRRKTGISVSVSG